MGKTYKASFPISFVNEGADGADGTSPVILTATPSDVVLKYGVDRTVQLRLFDGSTEIPSEGDSHGTYPFFCVSYFSTVEGCSIEVNSSGEILVTKTTTDDISGSFDVTVGYYTAKSTHTTHTISIGYTTAEDGEAAEAGYAAVTVTPSISSFVHSYGYEETVNISFTVYEGVTELFFDGTGTASCWRIRSSQLDENDDGTLSQTFGEDDTAEASYQEVSRVYRSDGTYQDFTLYITAATVYDAQAAWSVQVSPAVIAIETDDEGNLPTLGSTGAATALITVYRGNTAVAITEATYKTSTECDGGVSLNTGDGTVTVYLTGIDSGDTYTYYTGETDSSGNRKTAEYTAPAGAGSITLSITAEDNGTTWSADVEVAFTVSVTKLVASIWASNSQIWLGVDNVTDGLEATGISIEDKTITVTADNFIVQDNSGEEHVSITEDGGITFTGDSFKVQDEDGTEKIATTAGGEITLSGEDSEGEVKMSLTGRGLVLTHASGAQIMLTFSGGVPIIKAYNSDNELVGDLHLECTTSSSTDTTTANTYYFVVSSCSFVHSSSKNSLSDTTSPTDDSGVATAATSSASTSVTYTHTYTVTAVLYVLNNGTATIASTDITVTAEVGNAAATLSASSSASVASGASASFKYTGTVELTTSSSTNPHSSGFLSAHYASEDVANAFITIT